MTRSVAILSALMLIAAIAPAGAASDAMNEWEKCAARIKKDYPIPPATQEALNLMVQSFCGKKPAK